MDETSFWAAIACIDQDALLDGDEEGALAPLRAALAGRSAEELEGFEEALASALFALDGRAFAAAAGASGRSDDAFLYARCFVVARGRELFEAVRADPSRMPRSTEEWCEGLLSVVAEVYEESTDADWSFEPSVSYETGSNHAQWREG